MNHVWITLTRQSSGAEPVLQVTRDITSAQDHIEHFAAECGVLLDDANVDAGHDPTSGRLMWFTTPAGEARIEGPLEIED